MRAELLLLCLLAAVPAASAASRLDADDRKRAFLLTDLLIQEGRLEEAEDFARKQSEKDPEPGWRASEQPRDFHHLGAQQRAG